MIIERIGIIGAVLGFTSFVVLWLSMYIETDNQKLFQNLQNNSIALEKILKDEKINKTDIQLRVAYKNCLDSLKRVAPLIPNDKDKIESIEHKLNNLLKASHTIPIKKILLKKYILNVNRELKLLQNEVVDLERIYKKSYSRWEHKIDEDTKRYALSRLIIVGIVCLVFFWHIWRDYYRFSFLKDE